MSTVKMNEVKKPVEFSYSVFNNENWQYNVDKAFFLIACGMLYSIIRLAQNNFEASSIELFARLISGPFTVLFMIVLIESFAAVLVKVAFEPGVIVESKFKVIPKVFWNAIKESYKQALSFKQVYSTRVIRVQPMFAFTDSIFIGRGLCDLQGSINLPGYMKEPEHFKY